MSSVRSAMARHWPALLLVVLLLAVWLCSALLPKGHWQAAAGFTATAFPVLVAVVQYLYRRSQWWRLRLDRARLLVLNPESVYSIEAEYTVPDSAQALSAVDHYFGTLRQPGLRRRAHTGSVSAWDFNGLSVDVVIDDSFAPSAQQVLRLELRNIRRSFRGIERVISEEALPLLSRVEDLLPTRTRKYVSRVQFGRSNPYFGLFVSEVPATEVAKFSIEYAHQLLDQRDVIRVNQDYLEVVSDTARAAEAASLRYLALSQVA